MRNKYYIVTHCSCFFFTYIYTPTHSTHGGFYLEDTEGISSIFYKDHRNTDVPVLHHITAPTKLWNFLQISTYRLLLRLGKKKKKKEK